MKEKMQRAIREEKERVRLKILYQEKRNETVNYIIDFLIKKSVRDAEHQKLNKREEEKCKKLKEEYDKMETGEMKIEATSLAYFRKKRIERRQYQKAMSKVLEKAESFEKSYKKVYCFIILLLFIEICRWFIILSIWR